MIHNPTNEVELFIEDMYVHFADGMYADNQEWLHVHYRYGYCYYFAHMLLAAFNRGEVCWTAPYDHYVWVDTDGQPYDCEGKYQGEYFYLIPEQYIPREVIEFCKHLHPVVDFDIYVLNIEPTKEELIKVIEDYCKLKGLDVKPEVYESWY